MIESNMTINEEKIQGLLQHINDNGNLKTLTTNFDNTSQSIHRWFPFLAGFSNKLVSETISYLNFKENSVIYDPFMGSGTTGVAGLQSGLSVLGYECNPFLHKIGKLKINFAYNPSPIPSKVFETLKKAKLRWNKVNISHEHKILLKVYPIDNLKKLIYLRNVVFKSNLSNKEKDFLFLAITMSLPKASLVRINSPYLSWSHKREPLDAFLLIEKNLNQINEDLINTEKTKSTQSIKLYNHDTRKKNNYVRNNSADIVFTSPPYLNNFDYGENLKIFLYFWNYANNWATITKKFRMKAVASATTYYSERACVTKSTKELLGYDFLKCLPKISEEIISKVEQIAIAKGSRESKKSFDFLTALYFKDMFYSFREMYRIMKPNTFAFLIIGDSAPYGVHVPTDTWLGEMAIESGFSHYTLHPFRVRGTKWTTLKNRHNMKLRESMVILKKGDQHDI